MRPESMHPGHRLGWPALAVLALVPLVAAAMLLGLARGGRDAGVNAAVVNLDQAVTVNDQVVPLGRQLAADMVARDGDNITWTLADEADAEEGLADGRYSAVVVIPEGFSAAATSFSSNDAKEVRQATVSVTVSQNAPVSDAALAQEIAGLATDALNSSLTETYLDNIYVGFNTVADQFDTVVEAAAQLNDGATQLSEGVSQAASGSGELAEGMGELSDQGGTLSDGAQQLADGSGELADGANTVADGTGALSEGAQALSEGLAQLNAQTPQLVSGVSQLATGAEPLLGGIPTYVQGTVAVLDGVTTLRDGLTQVESSLASGMDSDQLAAVQGALTEVTTALREVQAAINLYFPGVDAATVTVEDLRASAAQLDAQLTALDDALTGYAQGTTTPPAEVEAFGQQLVQGYQCPVSDPDTCALLTQAYAQGVGDAMTQGFQQGAQTAQGLLHQPDPRTGQTPLQTARGFSALGLKLGEALINLRDVLMAGAPAGTDPLTLLEQLPTQLGAQLQELSDGVTKLREGADTILTSGEPLRTNADQLSTGSTTLLSGLRQLNQQVSALPEGISQLAAGSSELASGATQLSSGSRRLALGADELAGGATTFRDGAYRYVGGVAQAAEGANELSSGMTELSDGSTRLSEGLGEFHDQLAEGAEAIPTYDAEARAALSETVAAPIAKDTQLSAGPMVPVAALLSVVALWLGAVLAYAFAAPVPSDLVSSSRATAVLWLRTLGLPAAIGAGQGVLLGLVTGMALGLPGGRTLLSAGVLALVGLSFTAINHALAGWLGNVGRGISVLLLVATAALGLTSQVPLWLDATAGFSPLHNGLLLVRTVLADGAGTVGLAGGALLFAALAAGASYAALATRRRLTPEQFRRRVAAAS